MNHPTSGEPETTNTERASWGMASLAGLVAATGDSQGIDLTPGTDPQGAGHVLIDVLANLRHYANASGIDFDTADHAACQYFLAELHPADSLKRERANTEAAYRRYLSCFADLIFPTATRQALLHLARTAGIAVAYMDRWYIEATRGTALTDEQWARVAPLLVSYHEHVSADDGNHSYLNQILATADIPDPGDTKDSGAAAV